MDQARRGLELDPLSLYSNIQVAAVFAAQRDYDKAIAQAQKTLQIDANFGLAYQVLSQCYEANGMFDKSIEAEARELMLFGQSEGAMELKRVYATSGIKGVGNGPSSGRATPRSPVTIRLR